MLHLSVLVTSLVATVTNGIRTRATERARAATLLEYVLLAAVILGVIALFGIFFRGAIEDIIDRIRNVISDSKTSGESS